MLPMIRKLKYNARFHPAMASVFGRTVIARDMDVATAVANATELNCVTIEGDEVSKKGTFRGGWYDVRRSNITVRPSPLAPQNTAPLTLSWCL